MGKSYPVADVSVQKWNARGWGVGSSLEGSSPVVIPGSVPGDVCHVELLPKKQGVRMGRLLSVITPSEHRVEPPCPHASTCGGCVWQQLAYEQQLQEKQRMVQEAFYTHSVLPIIPAFSVWRYRNKMEYTFAQDKEEQKFLGLIRLASKGRVENIHSCHLSPSWCNEALQAVFAWWQSTALMAYRPHAGTGSLQTLTLREGKYTQEKLVMLTVSGDPVFAMTKEQISSFVSAVIQCLGPVCIFLRIKQAIAGVPTQFFEMQLHGPAHFQEKLSIQIGCETKVYQLKVSPTAFLQPNTEQAQKIYSQAIAMVGAHKRKKILDLYAGTSTLGLVFSSLAEEVLSIELNPYAVFDAEMNREENGVTNLRLWKGDVAQVLLEEKETFVGADLLLLDPPRTGLSAEALTQILSLQAPEILYISCAPMKQAADCRVLEAAGYSMVQIQPIDQFPHTVHIENITLLRKG